MNQEWSRSLKLPSAGGLDEAGLRFARAIYDETDGNPFFVNEVLSHLSEQGSVTMSARTGSPQTTLM